MSKLSKLIEAVKNSHSLGIDSIRAELKLEEYLVNKAKAIDEMEKLLDELHTGAKLSLGIGKDVDSKWVMETTGKALKAYRGDDEY